jgi:hypothetical protein
MIRIKENRCGYAGYKCVGIEELKEPFRYKKLVCDTEINRTEFPVQDWSEDTPDEAKYHLIDNYKNIPTLLKGFMMTSSTLIDMDVAVSYPEKECRTNVNPFLTVNGEVGFLDMFNEYSDRVKGRTEGSEYVDLKTNMLCFNTNPGTAETEGTDGDELMFEPGIIEPMLDTEFSPVGIELSTGVDASLDGIMLAIAMLTKWRTVIEGKINDIYTRLGHITGIRNMLISMQMESICDDFRIELVSGDPIQWTGSKREPRYRVGDGYVYVNGNPIYVSGRSAEGEFYMYINLYKEGTDPEATITAEMETEPKGDFSLGIGGVKMTYKTQRGVPTYRVYQIWQEGCMFEIDMVRTNDEGFLFRTLSGDSPYKAYPYGTCPKEGDEDNPSS